MKKILRRIGSLRITVVLVLVIAVTSVFGTLINQQEALYVVYRSPLFIGLLALLGVNLFACTALRLKPRLDRLGFLATHLGVLVILTGAIVSFLASEKGRVKLHEGEATNAYYAPVRIDPEKNLGVIEAALKAAGGRMVRRGSIMVATEFPRANLGALIPLLGRSPEWEIVARDRQTVTILFWPGIRTVRKLLPFTVRLDKFIVEYYLEERHIKKDLVVKDRQTNKTIATIPARRGESGVVNGYEIEIGQFLPNFVIDPETHIATTRNLKPANPAIGVSISKAEAASQSEHLWVFAKHPGITEHMRMGKGPLPFSLFFVYHRHIKSYVSEVTILDRSGVPVKKAAIEVNRPLTHRGYTVYQSNYDSEDFRWSGLQVVSDPGVWVIYAGFALLLAGVVFIFYAKPYLRRRQS